MKRPVNWQILLALALLSLSALFYLVDYTVSRDAHHIIVYFLGDLAFLFIEVLLVSLIIHRLLTLREKRERMDKLNMVIGAFFSEAGTQLIRSFARFDPAFSDGRYST